MRTSMTRHFSCLLIASILLLLLAGCATTTTTAAPTTAAPTTATTQAVTTATTAAVTTTTAKQSPATKFTLALMAPLTGNNKQYGDAYKNAVTMAVDDFNAAGGINGKKVTLKIYDDKSDQKEAINVANIIVSDKDVFATIGSFGSSVSMAAAPTYEKASMPFFSPNSSHPDFPGLGKMMYPLSPIVNVEMTAYSTMAYKNFGGKDLAILYQNTDQGQSSAKIFGDNYTSLGGKVVVQETFIPGGTKDFSPLLSKIKEKKAGIVFASANYDDAAQIILQADQLGLTGIQFLAQGQSVIPEFLKLLGAKGEGVIAAGTTPSYDASVVASANYPANIVDFINRYNKLYPNTPCNGYAAAAYDAAMISMSANKAVGSDPLTLLDEARKLNVPLVSGVGMKFGPNNSFQKDVFTYIIKNQQFQIYKTN